MNKRHITSRARLGTAFAAIALGLAAASAPAPASAQPKAYTSGFDRFVRKPVTGAMLADVIRDAMDGRG